MTRKLWIAAVLGAAGALGAGCGDPMPTCPTGAICVDAAVPDGGGDGMTPMPDGFRPDRGPTGPCSLSPGAASGAPCRAGDVCLDPLMCQAELAGMAPAVPATPGGPACPGDITVRGFPDSMCATICDPDGDGSECEADCQACNGAILAGRVRFGISDAVPGTCRPTCTPTMTDDGCERDGYACDVLSGTCMERCQSDEQCNFGIGDPDGDGAGDIVCEDLGATCNMTTGRCEVPGDDTANAGDDCMVDTDCEDNGLCLEFDDDPTGYCARLGCSFPGFECNGTDEICDVRAFGDGLSACLEACTVGAETTLAQRRGVGGGNPTCSDPGMACFWNGTAASTDVPNGSCLPGNYNDEPAYDVGTACLEDDDCWSPFGYGRCLFTNALDQVQSGMCAVGGCLGGTGGMAVGLLAGTDAIHMVDAATSAEICAAEDVCLNFGTTEVPTTFCVHTCDSAADCAPGYSCPNLNTADMPLFICWPFCQMDSDCHTGATCRDAGGGTCGTGETGCTCSDAMPAPDAGTPVDAGTPAVDAGTAPDAGTEDAG